MAVADAKKKPKFVKSLGYSIAGIRWLMANERNFRIHCAITVAVVVAGVILGISRTDWCLVALCIGAVMGMEAINTAIEKVCDKISPGYDKQIGITKDICAGAVLIVSIASVVTGLLVFVPHLLELIA